MSRYATPYEALRSLLGPSPEPGQRGGKTNIDGSAMTCWTVEADGVIAVDGIREDGKPTDASQYSKPDRAPSE